MTNQQEDIDISNRVSVITGLMGSGKSELAMHILKQQPRHLVYDPLGEYRRRGFNSYVPADPASTREYTEFITEHVLAYQPALFVSDECADYLPISQKTLPRAVGELTRKSRHYGIGCIFISQQPVTIHPRIRNLATRWFIFGCAGHNDINLLENIMRGLGRTAQQTDSYNFIVYETQAGGNSKYSLHAPVSLA